MESGKQEKGTPDTTELGGELCRVNNLKALKYTTEDWIRVLHENVLWAESELEVLREQGYSYEKTGDKIGLSYALGVYKKQLKELDPEHPYQLSWLIKCLFGENKKLKGRVIYLQRLLEEHVNAYKKKDTYTIK